MDTVRRDAASRVTNGHHARRRAWLAAAIGASLPLWMPGRAGAHHGFLGRYDFAHPLSIQGLVIEASYGRPHGRLRIQPATGAAADARAVHADQIRELEDAEERQMSTLIRPLRGIDSVEIVLDVKVSRRLADEPWMLQVGDATTVIAYRRLGQDEYAGELCGVAVALNDGRNVVGSTRLRAQGASRR